MDRALGLIHQGDLNSHYLDDLAGTLYLSPRQLRKRFTDHLDSSPLGFAQREDFLTDAGFPAANLLLSEIDSRERSSYLVHGTMKLKKVDDVTAIITTGKIENAHNFPLKGCDDIRIGPPFEQHFDDLSRSGISGYMMSRVICNFERHGGKESRTAIGRRFVDKCPGFQEKSQVFCVTILRGPYERGIPISRFSIRIRSGFQKARCNGAGVTGYRSYQRGFLPII